MKKFDLILKMEKKIWYFSSCAAPHFAYLFIHRFSKHVKFQLTFPPLRDGLNGRSCHRGRRRGDRVHVIIVDIVQIGCTAIHKFRGFDTMNGDCSRGFNHACGSRTPVARACKLLPSGVIRNAAPRPGPIDGSKTSPSSLVTLYPRPPIEK